MKFRDLIFLVIGGLLVISGMVLNSVLVTDADAQSGGLDMDFGNITCQSIAIVDKNGKWRGSFGLARGDATFVIYGDDGKTEVAYLGKNLRNDGEVMFQLISKSKTDKRKVSLGIDEKGGRFDVYNKMGEAVIMGTVGSDGGGIVGTYDKFGYRK